MPMKTQYVVTLAVVAGFGLGAVTVQSLHAQAKPPVYYIDFRDVVDGRLRLGVKTLDRDSTKSEASDDRQRDHVLSLHGHLLRENTNAPSCRFPGRGVLPCASSQPLGGRRGCTPHDVSARRNYRISSTPCQCIARKRRAARTARPRWSTRAFSSGASSAKV